MSLEMKMGKRHLVGFFMLRFGCSTLVNFNDWRWSQSHIRLLFVWVWKIITINFSWAPILVTVIFHDRPWFSIFEPRLSVHISRLLFPKKRSQRTHRKNLQTQVDWDSGMSKFPFYVHLEIHCVSGSKFLKLFQACLASSDWTRLFLLLARFPSPRIGWETNPTLSKYKSYSLCSTFMLVHMWAHAYM